MFSLIVFLFYFYYLSTTLTVVHSSSRYRVAYLCSYVHINIDRWDMDSTCYVALIVYLFASGKSFIKIEMSLTILYYEIIL